MSIQECPCIRPIEPPDDDRLQERGLEVAQVHSMASAGRRFKRLPVGDDPAGPAPNVLQGPITPDVAFRVLGVALDDDRAECVVGPDTSRAAAQRAVAARRRFGRRRKSEADRSAVARTLERKWRLFLIHGNGRWLLCRLTPELAEPSRDAASAWMNSQAPLVTPISTRY